MIVNLGKTSVFTKCAWCQSAIKLHYFGRSRHETALVPPLSAIKPDDCCDLEEFRLGIHLSADQRNVRTSAA
jgi:hypothetical protein